MTSLGNVANLPLWALRGKAVLPDGVVEEATVAVAGDRLVYAGPAGGLPPEVPAEAIVQWDGLVLPGLVDIHCHGGGGASFPDAVDARTAMAAVMEHRRHGTTSVVASLVTDSPQVLAERVAMLAQLAEAGELAGIHVEGPFLSDIRCGAQDPDKLQAPNPALVEQLAELAGGYLCTMTLAPELPGSVGPGSVTHALVARGAVPSYGHTDCTAAQMTAAVDDAVGVLAAPGTRNPLPTATHLFNGMRPIHHRDPGPVLAALASARRGRMVVEMIADGTHLDPATVSEVFDLVGADSVALVTDAMAAAGMADGLYQLGPQAVRVHNGVARLERGDSIAGGTAHLLDVVRSTVQASGVSLALAVRSASLVPARVLGLSSEVGALKAGLRADLLLTDANLKPKQVIRAGAPVA